MEAHTDIYMHIIKQPTLYPKLEVSNPTAALTRGEKVTKMYNWPEMIIKTLELSKNVYIYGFSYLF